MSMSSLTTTLWYMLNHFSFILTIMKKMKLENCTIYKGRLTVSHLQHVFISTLRFDIIPVYPKQWHNPACIQYTHIA